LPQRRLQLVTFQLGCCSYGGPLVEIRFENDFDIAVEIGG
jgi:hypothetical protein